MTENQINEMFKLMTTAVSKLNEHDARFEKLEKGQDELRKGQDELREGQDELRQEFDKFREETRLSFVEVKKEIRHLSRKTEILQKDVTEVRMDNRDLEERIEVLEQKVA